MRQNDFFHKTFTYFSLLPDILKWLPVELAIKSPKPQCDTNSFCLQPQALPISHSLGSVPSVLECASFFSLYLWWNTALSALPSLSIFAWLNPLYIDFSWNASGVGWLFLGPKHSVCRMVNAINIYCIEFIFLSHSTIWAVSKRYLLQEQLQIQAEWWDNEWLTLFVIGSLNDHLQIKNDTTPVVLQMGKIPA